MNNCYYSRLISLCCTSFVFSAMMINLTLAHAESSDRDKPIELEADTVTVNDAKKTSIYSGNVILTQGTLVIRGDKLVVREDIDGFQHSTSLGNPTTFKQKREGTVDEYIEGSSLRIEYDGRMDKVQLYTKAAVKRGGDVITGDYISYDANSEYAEVLGGASAPAGGTPGRVKAVIQPKKKVETGKPEVKTELKPVAPMIINKTLRFSNKLELNADPLSTKE